VAESSVSLLPTIVSRCHLIRCTLLRTDVIERALADRWQVPPDRAKLLAHLSGGRLGWALREVEDVGAFQARRDTLDAWRSVFTSSRAKRFEQVARLTKDRDEEPALRRTLEMWQSLTHDLLLAGIDSQAPLTNLDYADEIRALATHIPAARARRWLAALQRVERGIERNLNLRLALEAALLEAPLL